MKTCTFFKPDSNELLMLSSNILRPSLLELTSVLGDSSRWIYSSVTNATRTNGLASGKFGLELAILENKNSSDWDELVNVCRSLDPFQDDCIDFVESGLSKAIADPLRLSRLIDSRVGLTRNSANRSDAFVGVVSAAWALKVAGNPTLGPKDFIELTSLRIRPFRQKATVLPLKSTGDGAMGPSAPQLSSGSPGARLTSTLSESV